MPDASNVGLILWVEDTDEQYEAMSRAFKQAGISNPVHRCRDGDDALDYLSRRGAYAPPAPAPRPALILLDLDMPGTDGREALLMIKADPDLAAIPVVVVSISENPRDVRHTYQHGGAGYVVVRRGLEGFVEAAAGIRDYWFKAVILP